MGELDHNGAALVRVAGALARALTAADVAAVTFEHVGRELGAGSIGLWLLAADEDVVRFAGAAGFGAELPEDVADMAIDADLPAAIVVRTGEMVAYANKAERDERWPILAGLPSVTEAVVSLPLKARGRTIGCLSAGFEPGRQITDEVLSLLSAVAEQCGLALDRAMLYDDERRARETVEFLAEGTRLMVSSLEPAEVLSQLVRLAVPRLAQLCAVYVVEGRQFRRVAVEIDTPAPAGGWPIDTDRIDVNSEAPMAVAYRTGLPQVVPDVGEAMAAGVNPQRRNLAMMLGLRSGMAVPIRAQGEAIGVMALGFAGPKPKLRREVLDAAIGLAGRAGIALDNARRYTSQLDMVKTLTAALLPERLPTVPGLVIAARYVPASGGVCGDWYDVEELPDGTVLAGIGDAAGHGLPAATLMAQLSNAARGLALVDTRPGVLLGHLSTLVARASGERIATALYGRIDPVSGEAQWASAGHPAWLLVDRSRTVQQPAIPPGVPLGVATDQPYCEHTIAMDRGATLVLFSDGVIERRGETIDEGIERLAGVVQAVADGTPDEIADRVMEELCRHPGDDCCLLVIRRSA